MIAAYREANRTVAKQFVQQLVASTSRGLPAVLRSHHARPDPGQAGW